MFARKIRVEYEKDGKKLPCPLKWLDSFWLERVSNDAGCQLRDGFPLIAKQVVCMP